jgi:hypothetical protein
MHAYGGILYFFHVMGDQSPAHGSLSAFTGGLKEEAGRIDLSHPAARWEKEGKKYLLSSR